MLISVDHLLLLLELGIVALLEMVFLLLVVALLLSLDLVLFLFNDGFLRATSSNLNLLNDEWVVFLFLCLLWELLKIQAVVLVEVFGLWDPDSIDDGLDWLEK
jgi:hypothetical protein